MSFPEGFVWGTATSSYQIEGSPREEGGGESVWDMLCRKPGAIWNGESGDIACEHYYRYEGDVALMNDLDIQAYRFSIAWPRVLPAGTGAIHVPGLDFYDKLVDALLDHAITPYVTLFHWDYPYELYCKGGWLNRDSSDWFAEYARVLVDRLSDRVGYWITLNEPQCFLHLGHSVGNHAPGDKLGVTEVLRAAHNALLAHGKAVQTIRAHAKMPPKIGFAPVGMTSIPASEGEEDIEAARARMFSVEEPGVWNNAWLSDPVFLGGYPEEAFEEAGDAAPDVRDGDMELINQPLDFYGVNIYHGDVVQAGEDGEPLVVPLPTGSPRTMFYWQVTPEALYWGPRFFFERYKKPVIITENGIAVTDWLARDGAVHDPQRIDYLHRHLTALEGAIANGVDVQGYFQWSLLDNFEWAEGYKLRFGLIFVDYETQERIPKDSAYWYQEVIQTNGESLHEDEGDEEEGDDEEGAG